MPTYKVSYEFARLSDPELSDFGNSVSAKMENNPSYPAPIYTPQQIRNEAAALGEAIVNASQGGTQLTALKNAARATLVESLRAVAAYVQAAASNDLAVILSSGFTVNKTDRTRTPLDKPVLTNIDNFASTQLMVSMPPVANARAYEFRTRVGAAGDWKNALISTKARGVILGDMTPGATYDIQARAVGGSTGYSDWSDPVSHMAT